MESTAFCFNAVFIRTRCSQGMIGQTIANDLLRFRVKRYGMNLLVTNDSKLLEFLKPLLDQIEGSQNVLTPIVHFSELLAQKRLKRMVLVIINIATKEVLERWQFDVEVDNSVE